MLAMGELGAVLVEYVSRTHTAVAFVLAPAPNALFGGLAGADSFSDFNKCVTWWNGAYAAHTLTLATF
mgnify:FL=1